MDAVQRGNQNLPRGILGDARTRVETTAKVNVMDDLSVRPESEQMVALGHSRPVQIEAAQEQAVVRDRRAHTGPIVVVRNGLVGDDLQIGRPLPNARKAGGAVHIPGGQLE